MLSLQIGLALLLFLASPGLDRFECFFTAMQFLLEGIASTLLLLQTEEAAIAGFVAALIAIFIPVALNLYDGLFVPVIVRLRSHEKATCQTWLMVFLGVLLSVPSAVIAALGCSCNIFDAVNAAAEEAVGAAAGVAEECAEEAVET